MEFSKIIEQNWKLLVGALVAVIIIGGGVVIMNQSQKNKEKQAQEAYFLIEKKLIDLKEKKSQPEVATKAGDKKDKVEKKTEPVDYSGIKTELEKFIGEYPSSVAAQMAALHLATILTQEKNLDTALTTLQKVAGQNSGLVNVLVQQQIGLILADKDKCDEAITVWQKVLDKKDASFLHDEIKIQQALCYAKTKDLKKAEEILTNLSNQSANAEMGNAGVSKEAEKYLRLIQYKKSSGT